MDNQKNSFSYSYSANQQAEVKKILEKYIPKEQNKMEQLVKLDRSAEKKGTAYSIAVGVISTLIMGFGMSCTMVMTQYFVLGVIVGIVGIVGIVLAYPIYCIVTKREREKIAPQIVKLSEDIMREN